tara:strand:- start:53 stop:184 length:132 start_codon:yes stop_codon:yes gene_type:complete
MKNFKNKKWGRYKKWENTSFLYFANLESDFRLLNKPFTPIVLK